MKLISSYDGKDVKDEKFKGEMPSGAGKPEVESLTEFILKLQDFSFRCIYAFTNSLDLILMIINLRTLSNSSPMLCWV